MSAACGSQNGIVKTLHAQLDGICAKEAEIVQNGSVDVIRSGGQVDFVNQPPPLIVCGNSKKRGLLVDRKPREAPAEEGYFNGFKTAAGQRGQIGFNDSPRVRWRNVRLPGSDGLLVAEDAVIGTAAVGYEDGNDRVFFHK